MTKHKPNKNGPSIKGWTAIVNAVRSALGFFVLVFLGGFALVSWGAGLFQQVLGAVLMFISILFIGICAVLKPECLMYDKEAWMAKNGHAPFGTKGETISPDKRFTTDKSVGEA